MPQLCINSARVRNAVAARAALIGDEVAKGVAMLHAAGKDDLFVGVIAGWETQIGRDFDTGKSLGYCALTNAGFSVKHPPPDRDRELSTIIEAFAGYWAQSLVRAGVPKGKVYSHIAFMSNVAYEIGRFANPGQPKRPYLESINFTPPSTAFCADCIPGFSTYPQPGHLEQLQTELKLHGNAEWASSEGTAIDPAIAERDGGGVGMETYLGDLFNNGARLVNVFGWDVGPPNNPFRRIAESDDAVAAYRKFLTGQNLREAAIPIPNIPPADLPEKIHRIQSQLPGWIAAHGTATVKPLMEQLQGYLQQQQFDQASKTADQILKLLGSR